MPNSFHFIDLVRPHHRKWVPSSFLENGTGYGFKRKALTSCVDPMASISGQTLQCGYIQKLSHLPLALLNERALISLTFLCGLPFFLRELPFRMFWIKVAMDTVKAEGRKNTATKAWERWRWFIGCGGGGRAKKSTSLIPREKPRKRSARKGFLPVDVGAAEKQRFMIEVHLVNHPLFQTLLEEVELKYGYSNEGPVSLPCDVDTFHKVLAEINSTRRSRPTFVRLRGSRGIVHKLFALLSP